MFLPSAQCSAPASPSAFPFLSPLLFPMMLRASGSSARCWRNRGESLLSGWTSTSASPLVSTATSIAADRGGAGSCVDRRTDRLNIRLRGRKGDWVAGKTVLTVTGWFWAAAHWGPDWGHACAPAGGWCVRSWRRWPPSSSPSRTTGQTCDQISANQVLTGNAEPASNLNMSVTNENRNPTVLFLVLYSLYWFYNEVSDVLKNLTHCFSTK